MYAVQTITAKSILRKYKKLDSWFGCRYGMNLYRGCTHNCVYCDGRAEKYQVDGEFGCQVSVKTNALQLLQKELNPAKKRLPFGSGFILPGGGVGDSYQPVEAEFRLTRQMLQLCLDFQHPMHILTKSCLAERDIDLITQLYQQNKAVFSMSFSTLDDDIAAIFEPGVPKPSERLQTLQEFINAGIPTGIFLMPVLPFITDDAQSLTRVVATAAKMGVNFVIFGELTLKTGRQKDYFTNTLLQHFPQLELEYHNLYPDSAWGNAQPEYHQNAVQLFHQIAKQYDMPVRMPLHLYPPISLNEKVQIMLEYMDYFVKAKGQRSQFGYAAHTVSQLTQPLPHIRHQLEQINGIGKQTAAIIREILDTGESKFLNWLQQQ